jgi:hypothetical protein
MEVKDMSASTLASTLEGLLKLGKITEADLFTAMAAEPSMDMKNTVDLVHSIMCVESHGKDASGSGRMCEYYVEDNLAEGWALPTHVKWLKSTADLMKEYHLTTLGDLKNAIRVVSNISEDLRKRAAVDFQHFRFIGMLLISMLHVMMAQKEKGLSCSVPDEPKQLTLEVL